MYVPNALLWHPHYKLENPPEPLPSEVLPIECIMEGCDRPPGGNHIISHSSILKKIWDSKYKVVILQTCYKPVGPVYIPTAVHRPLHAKTATKIYGLCNKCDSCFAGIDNVDSPNQRVRLKRALHDACTRNTLHVIWLENLFNIKLALYEEDKFESFLVPPDKEKLVNDNESILLNATNCLPPQPEVPVKHNKLLYRDKHFHHFYKTYKNIPFQVAVSTEVVLRYENNPTTETLGYINVIPRKGGKYTIASLSIPRRAPRVWKTIFRNSRRFGILQHQLMISNLATKSPDGICFSPKHFNTLPWDTHIKPNLLKNLYPGLRLPVVNITGNNLNSLTSTGFNIFKATQP